MAYPTPPTYVTGRRLWLLAMPYSVRPKAQLGIEGGDPGFVPGQVSTVTRTGAGASGTVTIYSGGPTDTFAVDLNIVLGGALGTATYRYRLQSTDAWSATMVTPSSGIVELTESGLTVLLAGTFTAAENHAFTTVESPQQVAIREAIALEVDRLIRTRGALPLDADDIGADLEILNARLCAWELLSLRGFDPKGKHDQLILHRARRARQALRKIREEMEQGGWGGQDTTAGVALHSQDAQGRDLW